MNMLNLVQATVASSKTHKLHITLLKANLLLFFKWKKFMGLFVKKEPNYDVDSEILDIPFLDIKNFPFDESSR